MNRAPYIPDGGRSLSFLAAAGEKSGLGARDTRSGASGAWDAESAGPPKREVTTKARSEAKGTYRAVRESFYMSVSYSAIHALASFSVYFPVLALLSSGSCPDAARPAPSLRGSTGPKNPSAAAPRPA